MALKEQMELFEDGGLMQEGGTVDPVSGNNVPVGSTQEEVRDDIPAQLSEGEFVFPADVVRYWGLETLMKMRQEAKAGLKMMDAMGQMGNSEEAVIPDDIPFDVNDLDMEDDGVLEYAQGGVVNAQAGAYMPPGMYNPQPQYGIAGYQTSQFQSPSIMPIPPMSGQPIMQPTMPMQPPIQGTGNMLMGSQYTPTTTQPISMGTGTGAGGLSDLGPPDEYKLYRNEAGLEIQVPFKNGKVLPTFNIPEGYTLASEQKQEELVTKPTSEPKGQVDVSSDSESDKIYDTITQGDKGQFTTTDMRGVGYDQGAIRDAARAGSKVDEDLLDELGVIARGQAKDIGPTMAGVFGLGPGSLVKQVGVAAAQELGVGKFEKTKGVNSNREVLTSQKVAMDAFFSLDTLYSTKAARDTFKEAKGISGQRLHELAPEVKRSLVDTLKSNREALAESLKGKTAEDLRNEINNTTEGLGKDIAELGISKTVKDERGREREKTYGQLFAEARATKSARDALAEKYGLDAKGKTLSQIQTEAKEEQRKEAERQAYRDAFRRQQETGGSGKSANDDAWDADTSNFGASDSFAKGGLVKQMKQSGLASEK